MNQISENEDLSGLIDKTIIQICLGLHEVVINIEDGLYIILECQFSFNGENWHDMNDIVNSCADFASLIGKVIVFCEIVNNKTVLLKVDNGKELYFYDSNEHYESFQILLPLKHIIV